MTKPLRKIVSRSAFNGAYMLNLDCGHSIWSYRGRQKQQNIRCQECPDA